MRYESYTDHLLYHMEQTTAYCKEKGEQYLKAINAGLTLDQFVAVDTIVNNAGICQMDLAKLMLKDRVYTSRLLSTLEESGLIERKNETKGKRLVKKLYITPEGEKIHDELEQELKETYSEVFEEITDEELETIKKGIIKLKNCISKFTIMPL